MDLEEQEAIKQTVEAHGADDVVVILGSPDPESAEMFAETVRNGDPTWAGPLAGVPLGLPVYHITEPEVKQAVDPTVYQDQVELMEMALELEPIWERIRAVRERSA
jgi:glycine reductase